MRLFMIAATAVAAGGLAITAPVSATIGYGIRPLGIAARVLYTVSGISLVIPVKAFGGGQTVNAIGAALCLALIVGEYMMKRSARAAQAL